MVATAVAFGFAWGFLPGVAGAAGAERAAFDAADRSLGLGGDWQMIFWMTVFAVLVLFAVTSIGYLYRRERGLDWEFQKPDAPHDDHH